MNQLMMRLMMLQRAELEFMLELYQGLQRSVIKIPFMSAGSTTMRCVIRALIPMFKSQMEAFKIPQNIDDRFQRNELW